MGYTWAPMSGASSAKGRTRKGVKNLKDTSVANDLRAAMRRQMPDCNPLLRLLELAEDEKTDPMLRAQCYTAVLPYVASKSRALPAPDDSEGETPDAESHPERPAQQSHPNFPLQSLSEATRAAIRRAAMAALRTQQPPDDDED